MVKYKTKQTRINLYILYDIIKLMFIHFAQYGICFMHLWH